MIVILYPLQHPILTKMAISTENLLQKASGLINEAVLPDDLQSPPWNDFVCEISSHEMATRHLRMSTAKVWEAYARKWRKLLPDLQASQSWPVYCGSYAEGMPNAGDLDTMFVASWMVTYEYTGYTVKDKDQLPFVTSSDHPGFIKILVPHAIRKFYNFKDYQIRKIRQRFYLSSMGFLRTMQEWGTTGSHYNVHGPAFTLSATEDTSYDIVHAIRCTEWPTFAQDIFHRSTKIPEDLAEKLRGTSLYAVAIGHALSKDADVEWRLSFSEVEKCLVENWNETQFNCYYLLKNFKMIHLKNPDVLCSYFMKTVVFWMSDVLPKEWWSPSRLVEAFYKSLFLLQYVYRKRYLPNYFIPQNNMIKHKKRKGCLALADLIHSILCSGHVKEIIAELLCEEQLEVVQQVLNVPIPVQSCQELCTVVRQYCQSSVSFSEALLVNEASILFSLTVMMAIWNRTQCQAMEAILEKLPELVSSDMVKVFHTMITRQIADSYHSFSTRDSKKTAERLYKESLSLVYPCGFDDEGLSGNIQLALFYYLEGDSHQALTVLHDFIPMIDKAVKMNHVQRYILITFPSCTQERFARDEFLYPEVSGLKAEFPITVNVIVVGLYILIRSHIQISSKDSLDDAKRFFMLLKACGDQLTTPDASDTWTLIIRGVQSTLEEQSSLFMGTLEPRSKIPLRTRNQKLKHFWED